MSLHFGFDDGLQGFFVVVEREPLTPGCLSVVEIDWSIDQLKSELDRVGARMKLALATRQPFKVES